MDKEFRFSILQIIITLIIFLMGIFSINSVLKISLFLVAYLIVGFDVIKNAFLNIIHGEFFDENFLMTLATTGALITGEYPEAVMVMWLYKIGETFQDYAVDKSKKSIGELMNLKAEYANVEIDGRLTEKDPTEINVDDIIIVKPGEKIPLDGIIVEGETMLDTSALTGESLPKNVENGSLVYAGTINLKSMIKIKVIKKYEDSTVSKILDLLENSASKKAKAENFITVFARYYTPIVVLCAIALAFLPPLFIKGASLYDYVHRACSFLVISCPCALVISIPLGFFCGIGKASKKGILIKGSNYIEALSKIKTMVFDKTGTLTEGSFDVVKINALNISNDELLKISAYAENYSEHPIAQSIKKAYGNEINGDLVSDSTDIPGCGIEVNVDGNVIDIGNSKLMNSINADFKAVDEIGTIVYVAINKKYVGYIVIADKIKDESKDAIEKLRLNNINTIMLTGDNEKIAEHVSSELEINKYYAELLPNEKVAKVNELLDNRAEYGVVAFAGDGINDAPVLANADIGIAMGGLGADSAIEAADVVIMDDDVSKIDTTIKIAKRTLRIIKQNIIFAITVKVLILVLSAFNISTMWEAVFADVGVLFLTILNLLRI